MVTLWRCHVIIVWKYSLIWSIFRLIFRFSRKKIFHKIIFLPDDNFSKWNISKLQIIKLKIYFPRSNLKTARKKSNLCIHLNVRWYSGHGFMSRLLRCHWIARFYFFQGTNHIWNRFLLAIKKFEYSSGPWNVQKIYYIV